MSLKHALLGFLSYGGMTGYQLKENFDGSIAHFWSANLSQIYPTLSQMESEGLLTMEVEYQESRPNRKVYRITDAGRKELLSWLHDSANLIHVREPFLIKVFFGGQLPKEEVLSQLRERRELHRRQLSAYRDQIRPCIKGRVARSGMTREGVFWDLTLEMGIKSEEAWIEWCEEAIRQIEALADDRASTNNGKSTGKSEEGQV